MNTGKWYGFGKQFKRRF